MQALLAILAAAGVTVTTHSGTCSNIQGRYNTHTRQIDVCLRSGAWDPRSRETLRHEAIHAIQHCSNGLDNMTAAKSTVYYFSIAGLTGQPLRQQLAPYINAGLPPHAINLEAEAWVLSAIWTDQQVAQQVKAVCLP